jgi:hypothetical protein
MQLTYVGKDSGEHGARERELLRLFGIGRRTHDTTGRSDARKRKARLRSRQLRHSEVGVLLDTVCNDGTYSQCLGTTGGTICRW